MRYQFLRFPGGKMKALTLSYDDGIQADKRLAELLHSHGMKCTFNINTRTFGSTNNPNKLTPEEIKEFLIDKGHEVAVHGDSHMAPGIAYPIGGIRDVLNCREKLESAFGTIIRGMAYPDSGITRMFNGNNRENIFAYLKDLGIVYSRTLAGDNNSFLLPENFYAWMPTAHHNNANLMKWTQEFLDIKEDGYVTRKYPRLFYLWGHSYEFDNNNNWNIIEEFCDAVAGKDDIWYATNIEIYDYVTAYNSLIMSADGSMVYNPTLIEVFFMRDDKAYSVKPGETINI